MLAPAAVLELVLAVTRSHPALWHRSAGNLPITFAMSLAHQGLMASIGRGAAGGDGLGTPLNNQADVQRRIKYAKCIVKHQLRRHSRGGFGIVTRGT